MFHSLQCYSHSPDISVNWPLLFFKHMLIWINSPARWRATIQTALTFWPCVANFLETRPLDRDCHMLLRGGRDIITIEGHEGLAEHVRSKKHVQNQFYCRSLDYYSSQIYMLVSTVLVHIGHSPVNHAQYMILYCIPKRPYLHAITRYYFLWQVSLKWW